MLSNAKISLPRNKSAVGKAKPLLVGVDYHSIFMGITLLFITNNQFFIQNGGDYEYNTY